MKTRKKASAISWTTDASSGACGDARDGYRRTPRDGSYRWQRSPAPPSGVSADELREMNHGRDAIRAITRIAAQAHAIRRVPLVSCACVASCGLAIVMLVAGSGVATLTAQQSPAAVAAPQPSAPAPPPPAAPLVDPDAAVFHHLHLVTQRPQGMADFYITLFPADAIVRGVFWETEGVRGDDAFILVSDVKSPRRYGVQSAIWHFGWGKVSVGETYVEHYVKEVNWRPPYPGLTSDLHIHLTSRDPLAAATWYETTLGAKREALIAPDPTRESDASPSSTSSSTSKPVEGRAEAILRLGKIRLVIHHTEKPLLPSRTVGNVDHLSFAVSDVKGITARARAAGMRILDPGYTLTNVSAVTIEGPDLIALELVDLKGPRFSREGH